MSTVSQATVFVGLDYHAASVQVCALSPDGKVLMKPAEDLSDADIKALVALMKGFKK